MTNLQANHQRPIRHLTSGELLARNTLWNLVGFMSPVVAAAVAIPVLIRGMGVNRFGVLSIAWIVLGYLSLLDLGLGRALTKLAAEKTGGPEEASIVPITWTSLLLLFGLGVVGGSITSAISPWLIYKALKVPAALQAETLHGFFVLAASIPVVTVTSGLRGLLEALQRFRILTLIRIPLSVFSFGGPLLVLPFSHSLVPVFEVLVAGRLIGCLAHLIVCFQAVPALRRNFVLEWHLVPALVKFGSWMTVTNLLGPAVIYLDRFLIGGVLSLTAVAYYTAPFDMLSRLWLIPAALIGVLFPAFAATFKHQPERAGFLLARGVKYVLIAVFPIVLVVMTLGPQILRVWLGTAFEQNSVEVLRWLAAGIFLSCLAQVPFTLILGAGRPDVTAKLIMVELPLYLAAVWPMTARFGIKGTAIAWAGRAALEGAFLFFYAGRLVPAGATLLRRVVVAAGGAMAMLYLASLPQDALSKAAFLLTSLALFALAAWWWGLRPDEYRFLLGRTSETSAKPQAH